MPNSPSVIFVHFCLSYSSIALLFYDYALTWTTEVKYMWHKKFKISTALYIACRYAMVSNVLYTLAQADKLPTLRLETSPCRQTGSFFQRLLNGLTLPMSGLLTARFLLHLRDMEFKTSDSATASGNSQSQFQESLHFQHSTTENSIHSIVNEFGVDPVQRELRNLSQ
ncbi:hypothetical protein CVT26_011127 [Gymnopilus dilepis]|uniref:DUF6533 domain-containing protein n=1 Tax=Gymnopilus dilepis TaxID=231916 RepID=A0A409VYU1_9AGAR|nr:hypothetical protein CVT26_011127 [Gymnopilus dilepis]